MEHYFLAVSSSRVVLHLGNVLQYYKINYLIKLSQVTEMVVSFNEDSDSEVFEGNSNTSEQIAFPRTNSSSSSRKSSYNEDGTNLEKPPPADVSQSISLGQQVDLGPSDDRLSSSPSHISVVEWKPGSQLEDNLSHHSSSPNGNKESISDIGTCSEGGDLKMMYGSTVTVTIDPPRDDGGEDVMSQYLGRSEMEEITEPCSTKVLGGLFEKPSIEEEECDLYESLNDMDMAEEEDHDLPPPTKIYLLSRYNLVSSLPKHYPLPITTCSGIHSR